MEENFKNKIVNGLKNGFKMTKNSVKSIYDKSIANIAYMTETSLFYVIELEDSSKVKKLYSGIFDEENMVIYVKTTKNKTYKEYLKRGNKIQMDDPSKKVYIIDKTDFKTTFEYLVKLNEKYKTVSCYKIYLKAPQDLKHE